jgi:hypothetical protein
MSKASISGSHFTYVIAANISWYMQNTISGIRLLALDGWARTPLRPKYPKDKIQGPNEQLLEVTLTEIPNEKAPGFTKSERKAPEEPLQGRLASRVVCAKKTHLK